MLYALMIYYARAFGVGSRASTASGAANVSELSAKRPLQIAIDGLVATGKTTVGRNVARRLGILFFDTGVMYRAVALIALEQQIDIGDGAHCGSIAEQLDLRISPPTIPDGRLETVLVGNRDVTWDLRTDGVNAIVSDISQHHEVRAVLRWRQKRIAEEQSVVMAGRDITSVVLPNAQVKLWLTASPAERLRRRLHELQARDPERKIDEDAIRASIAHRDAEDRAQMHLVADTVVIDTEHLSEAQVLDRIVEVVRERYPSD